MSKPSPTGCRPCCHCGQQCLRHVLAAHCNQALLLSSGSISAGDIFCLFVVYKYIYFLHCKQEDNILSWEGGVPVLCAAGGDTACCGTVMESSINRPH